MRGGENEPSEHHKFTGSRKFASLASSDVKIFFTRELNKLKNGDTEDCYFKCFFS